MRASIEVYELASHLKQASAVSRIRQGCITVAPEDSSLKIVLPARNTRLGQFKLW